MLMGPEPCVSSLVLQLLYLACNSVSLLISGDRAVFSSPELLGPSDAVGPSARRGGHSGEVSAFALVSSVRGSKASPFSNGTSLWAAVTIGVSHNGQSPEGRCK